ncbi:MAG: TetR/AcrR family transcriptional regulator C-terminal domain-containing protein [Clostridiales bacterium]|nr:TetR/AcrR family transcriptional regulator C-terminal domain-containing protein [Clostridiales bacterium]
MNTPNNKRKRDSIARIEKAFTELLQDRELNEISISVLCKKAGLNRSTFYANYEDIYALADSIRDRLENNFAVLYKDEREEKINTNDYLKLFHHIYENQPLYRTYFKLGYDNNCNIGSYMYDTQLAARHFKNKHIRYHMEFFRNGLTSIIKMWLQNGCKESPQEMFEIIRSEYRGREEFFAEKNE